MPNGSARPRETCWAVLGIACSLRYDKAVHRSFKEDKGILHPIQARRLTFPHSVMSYLGHYPFTPTIFKDPTVRNALPDYRAKILGADTWRVNE